MALTDRQIRRQTEFRTAVVTDIDMVNRRITLRDQYGSILYASLVFSDSILTVPKFGEVWSVQRQNTDWHLTKKQDNIDYTDLEPGDKVIKTDNFIVQGNRLTLGSIQIIAGDDDPEGSISAPPGSLFLNSSGGADATMYVKESGTGNTGWVAK